MKLDCFFYTEKKRDLLYDCSACNINKVIGIVQLVLESWGLFYFFNPSYPSRVSSL